MSKLKHIVPTYKKIAAKICQYDSINKKQHKDKKSDMCILTKALQNLHHVPKKRGYHVPRCLSNMRTYSMYMSAPCATKKRDIKISEMPMKM